MKIRFDVNDADARTAFLGAGLAEALASVDETRRPNWGGFTAAQMMEHLLWGFELSTGRIAVAATTSSEWQQKARGFLHDNRPMPRSFENPFLKNGVPPLRFGSTREATAAVAAEASRFIDLSLSDPLSARVHPVFGPCSAEEWSRIHFKHCVHHLLQFDLIEVDEVTAPGA